MILLAVLSGCTAAKVEPGCSMEKTASIKISCQEKAKEGGATTISVPMP